MEQIKSSFSKSIMHKEYDIALLGIMLMLPLAMVQNLVHERHYRHQEVISEINQSWSLGQTLIAPVLMVPYKVTFLQKDPQTNLVSRTYATKFATFLPENLDINSSLIPETKERSLYKSVVYTSQNAIRGSFQFPDFGKMGVI